MPQNDAKEKSIRTVYNGTPQKLPGCDGKEYCPLDTFLDVLHKNIPSSYLLACTPKKKQSKPEDNKADLTGKLQ